MFIDLIIYTLIAGVIGTGLGGVFGALFKKDSNKITSLLLSFAAGIMLSITCFDLIISAVENSNAITAAVFILIGVLVIYILNFFIDEYSKIHGKKLEENHPKTHDDLDELRHIPIKKDSSKAKLLQAGVIMVLAIALHNFPEGLSIGSSFISNNQTGIMLTILIALHNIPEGMAISVPLISGGMSKLKAIILTSLSGAPTVLGAMLGYFIGDISDLGLAISVSLASGAMIYVVFGEILPQSILMYRSKAPAFSTIVGLIVGLILIYIL